jgi:hypothetical protein
MTMIRSARLSWVLLVSLWVAALGFVVPLGRDAWNLAGAGTAVVDVSGPCDFVAFWAVGRMAGAGRAADVFTLGRVFAAEDSNPAGGGLHLPWYYLPPGLLLPYAVHWLPFYAAFLVWELGLLLLAVAVLRAASLPWPVILAGAASPAALLNADLGQLGFLTASLITAGILLADRKPVFAGRLFGALIFKPQAALLTPIILLARRKISGLAAGAIVTFGLCGLTFAVFGGEVWQNYAAQAVPLSRFVLDLPFPDHPPPIISSSEFYGISVFWMLRSFGAGVQFSMILQALVSAAAAVLCWRIWRRDEAEPYARLAATLCLGLLATPYGYLYDLCGAALAFAALAYRERRLVLTDVLVWT